LGPGVYGTDDGSTGIAILEIFIRQRGKELYTNDGQRGFSKQDILDWFSYWSELRKTGACASPVLDVEYNGFTPAQTTLVAGKTAIGFSTSNQIKAFQASMTHKIGLFTCPLSSGYRDTGNYLKASMLI